MQLSSAYTDPTKNAMSLINEKKKKKKEKKKKSYTNSGIVMLRQFRLENANTFVEFLQVGSLLTWRVRFIHAVCISREAVS